MDLKLLSLNKMDRAAYKDFNQWLHVLLCVLIDYTRTEMSVSVILWTNALHNFFYLYSIKKTKEEDVTKNRKYGINAYIILDYSMHRSLVWGSMGILHHMF